MTLINDDVLDKNLVDEQLQENPVLEQTLWQALETTHSLLTDFAAGDFTAKIALSFGDSFDTQAARLLAQDFVNADFRALPNLEIRPAAEINGANGAFASATNTIYLSREFLPKMLQILELLLMFCSKRLDTTSTQSLMHLILLGMKELSSQRWCKVKP